MGKRGESAMSIVAHLGGREDEEMEEMGGKRRRGRGLAVNLPTSAAAAYSGSNASYSPRYLISRLLQRTPTGGRGEGVVGCRVRFPRHCCKQRREEKEKVADDVPRDAGNGDSGTASSVASVVEGLPSSRSPFLGRKPVEVSFNVGLSVGLLFFLARSATEFDKMTQLRTQMKILLKDIKDEVRRKDDLFSYSESNHGLSYSASNCYETTSKNISLQNYKTSLHLVGAKCVVESDRQSKCENFVRNNRCRKVDQMEAELEVELERLRLGPKGENSSVHPQHHMMELTNESNLSESSSISFEEGNEPKEEDNSKYGAVSARELERRLHELLEAQQQERITELESALELAERKLHEQEVEICWWRNTSKLASQRKDGTIFR